ncbi:MAG: hypothetical protein RIR26_401 [Pseudomonadota bacterium]|jgi:hypothetical protein
MRRTPTFISLFIAPFSVALACSSITAFAQDLDFDAPTVEPKKDAVIPQQLGPVSNITIGGAVDWRVIYTNGAKRPAAFIHVNELVVSANVGEHISVSAEQLLLTSELGTVVGQDHGFVVVSLVQLPFVPKGMSLKLGRFRGKYGLDAQVDSPANIFPSQELRSNGFVTDIGLGLDYAFSDFEWTFEVFNGPDYMSANNQKAPFLVDRPPVQTRFSYQPASNVKIGASALYGQTWDNQVEPTILDMGILGSRLETSRTIERRRFALDASLRTSFAEFYGEGIYGRDKGRLAQAPGKSFTVAKGALGRVDVPLFKIGEQTRTKLALQYDTWEDASYDGRVAFLSGAFSILNDDGWTVRVGGSASDVVFKKNRPDSIHDAPWSATTQLLVTF